MSRHNVILMLVEGTSDETLLVPAFTSLLAPMIAEGESFRCDVTTLSLFPQNARNAGLLVTQDLRETVRDRVQYHVERSDFRKADYSHIVQVVDLDGAFIPDDLALEDKTIPRIQYGESNITIPDRQRQLEVMHTKRNGIGKLIGMKKIVIARRTVPYRVFYVSRNLEHAFSNSAGNNTMQDKNLMAALLADRYSNDPEAFRHDLLALYALHNQTQPMEATWENSWSRITAHDSAISLQRGSNLAFLPQFAQQ